MKYKIIKTKNYLFIVDDSEIKAGDLYYLESVTLKNMILKANESRIATNEKKIIAHLPLNGASVIEGVDLLPSLEDEVEKLAKEYYQKYLLSPHHGDGTKQDYIDCVKFGYNKAKEKYKYTEEDLKKAIEISKDIKYVTFSIDEIIKSLQQPKYPVAFECEMMNFTGISTELGEECIEYIQRPKTITNSQGETVLEGKYIY